MKAITVHQPYATLICSGVKSIENRSWSTEYRGRILIHSSAVMSCDLFDRALPLPVFAEYDRIIGADGTVKKSGKILDVIDDVLVLRESADKKHRAEYELLKTEIMLQGDHGTTLFVSSAIIGMVTISDIVRDSKSPWSEKGQFHWILRDPVLFDEPIRGIKGRLKLWEFDDTLLGSASRRAKPMVRR